MSAALHNRNTLTFSVAETPDKKNARKRLPCFLCFGDVSSGARATHLKEKRVYLCQKLNDLF